MTSDAPDNWEVSTLGAAGAWYSGGTPDTSVADYWGGEIPWISASSLHDFYIRDSERRVTQYGLENGTRLMPANTILFVVRGMSLKTEFRVGIACRPVAFGQDCKAIVARPSIEPLFLANILRARESEILSLVDEASHGTGRLQTSALMRLKIPVPPLPEQRAIAHILATLDDKIELNRHMNETLEALARAIFKSWFVDFDPVRAKMEGRQPAGMEAETAALFPAEFEDSALGKIPRGWKVKTVEEIAERVGMGPFGSSIKVETFVPEGIPVVSGQHLHGFMLEDNTFSFITQEHADRLRKAIVERGDVIFTHAGNIGQVGYIPENSRYERYIMSQRQFFMRCNLAHVSPSFMALYFRSFEGQSLLLANTSSTGVPSISRPVTYLRSIKLVVPSKPIMDAFDSLMRPLLLKYRQSQDEINTLATLRDTLLPKLLNGEVRVKDLVSSLGMSR